MDTNFDKHLEDMHYLNELNDKYDLFMSPVCDEPFNSNCMLYYLLGEYCGTYDIATNGDFCCIQLDDIVVRFKLQIFYKYFKKLNFTSFNSSLALFIYLTTLQLVTAEEMAVSVQPYRFDFVMHDLCLLPYLVTEKKIYFIYTAKNNIERCLSIWPIFYKDYGTLYNSYFKDVNDFQKFYISLKHINIYNLNTLDNEYAAVLNKTYLHIFNKFYNFGYTIYNNVIYYSNNFIKICYKTKHTVLFLRKQKCFNKGRYSRNRQLYRTGVYWCLYINIIALVGLNYLFYKFTINFMLYWWFFFITLNFFIIPQFIKNNLYIYSNVKNVIYFYIFLYSKIFELAFTFFFNKNNLYLYIIFLQKKIYNLYIYIRNLFI